MIAPENYPPIIQAFVITGLHGDRDIEIEFNSSIKVLVGENGLGKTTILNTLYAVLSGRLSRLEKLDFEEIKLWFQNQEFSLSKKELNQSFKKISILSKNDKKFNQSFKNKQLELFEKEYFNLKENTNYTRVTGKYFIGEGNYPTRIQDSEILSFSDEDFIFFVKVKS